MTQEKKDQGAGLIHQVASPTAGTEPRLTTHTPGPWRLRPLLEGGIPNLSNQGQHYVMAEEGRVALVDSRTDFSRGQGYAVVCHERDANAYLIAAAPDLLEALRQVQSQCAGHADEFSRQIFLIARDAIAKAEGR